MPSKKKKYNARFPPARIKKIMQKDEDVGKVAAPVPVLISKALEIFVESLITKASHETFARKAKTLTTSHIKQCIEQESKFDFLKDLVENVPTMACEEEDSNHSGSCHAEKQPNSRSCAERKQKMGRESSAQGSLQSVDEPSSDEDSFDSDDSDSRDEVPRHPAERSGVASTSKITSSSSSSSSSLTAHTAPAAPFNSVPYQPSQPLSRGAMFPPNMPPHLPPPHGAFGENSPAMGSYIAPIPHSAPDNNNHHESDDDDDDYDA